MKKFKKEIKYIVSLVTLLALFICVGNMVMAEEKETIVDEKTEKIEIVKAEDIGIKEVEKVQEESPALPLPVNEVRTEDEVMDVPVQNKPESEPVDTEPEYESPEADPVEVDEFEVPEGMYEGYEEGVYFEPNCTSCDIHEACFVCEEHNYVEDFYCDEEINPNEGNWVLDRTCVICGHGNCEPVTEEFVDECLSKLP